MLILALLVVCVGIAVAAAWLIEHWNDHWDDYR